MSVCVGMHQCMYACTSVPVYMYLIVSTCVYVITTYPCMCEYVRISTLQIVPVQTQRCECGSYMFWLNRCLVLTDITLLCVNVLLLIRQHHPPHLRLSRSLSISPPPFAPSHRSKVLLPMQSKHTLLKITPQGSKNTRCCPPDRRTARGYIKCLTYSYAD